MATTNNFSLPYPLGNDPYNIPEDIANLAKSIDSSLKAVSDSVATLDYSTAETVEEVQRNLEILEQEINRAGLPNVEQLMVDIEEARKELEAAQEEFSVGQAELGVHLTNLRDERMPALEKSVRDAQDEMDTAMDEFMTRQTQFEDSISTAETEIEAAKKRLDTAETDVEAAIEYAGNAQTAAEAAESRAVEAMSFVSTVLQNGSFEDGLTNWTTAGGAGVIDDITRSGELAGLLPELGDALTYDETLTAVAGQVWELSGFYYCGIDPQIGITFTYYDENGTALETVSETEMAGRVGVWNSFGPFRIEAPENSATMGFTIESVTDTGYVRVDDIALRDVTDVVRLEHAATAARQAADQALAELELMRLALDGPGGLQDRLDSAEDDLENIDTELPKLEGRLTEAFGEADKKITEDAAKDATSKADAAREAAEAAAATDAQERADEAIRQAQEALDNLEVGSRNYFLGTDPGPPFNYSSNNSRTGRVLNGYEDGVFWLSGYLVESPDSFYISTYANWTFDRGVGISYSEDILPLPSVVTQSMEVMCHEPIDIRLGTQGEYTTLSPGVWSRFETTYEPSSRPSGLYSTDSQEFPGDTRVYLRNWKLEKGHKATDWTPAPEDFQARIDAAQAKAEEAHEDAGNAWSHADAAMTRAGEAESTAIAEAKRLAKDAKDRAEEAIAKGKVIDTRNDNQDPEWYWLNYRLDSVTEFKFRHVMEIPGYTTGYAYVTTVVPWSDPSGGPIVQTATIGDIVMSRESIGNRRDEAVWGEWVDPVAEAKDLAENLPKVLHGTTAPSGTAPDGSIWWQHQGSLSGSVIGQWNRVNGSWQSTPIDSQAIANLDVGKLTAGSAEIAEAVLNKIFANEIFANHVEALEAYIGGSAFKDGVITTKVLEAAKEIITGLFAAEYGLIEEELVVKGKLFADNATLINAAMQNLSVTERAEFVAAFAKELYAERFTAEVARISNLTVAARNLIPGMFNIANEIPPPFEPSGFGVNTGDPSVWIRGTSTVSTSSEEDALIYLEAGVNYKFSVETAASVPGTMYYFQLIDENGENATGTVVELTETTYLLSQEIAGPNKNMWWPAESTFWVQNTGGYRLKIYANHSNGADNPTGYQWFRHMRVESMNDGQLIVPGSIDASRINAHEIFSNQLVSDQIWANIVRAKMLEADEAIIGGALIKDEEITVNKLDALDEILTEMLRVRKIDAGDIAADAITADKISGGAIDGKTITGANVRTAASGSRVELTGNSLTGYNSNNSVASRFTPTGISLTDGAGQLQDIGNHIYGSVSVNSWIGAKGYSTPTGSSSGYGAFYLPNNRTPFTVSSRQYRCDVSFNIFAHGMTVGSDGWVLFEAKPKDSANNSLAGAFFTREIYVGAPMFDVSLNYSMSEIRNLPSSVNLGQSAIVGWRMRNKGLAMCRVSNVTITLTPV